MTHKPFDLEAAMRNGGKCMTRDGKPVRIICIDRHNAEESICGLIMWQNQSEKLRFEEPLCWRRDGTNSDRDFHLFLINIPQKRIGWIAHRAPDKWDPFTRYPTPIFLERTSVENYIKRFESGPPWAIQEISWEE